MPGSNLIITCSIFPGARVSFSLSDAWERWVYQQINGCRQQATICYVQILWDSHGSYAFLPQVLEVKLCLREHELRSNEVALNTSVVNSLWFPVSPNDYVASPCLHYLANVEGIRTNLYHDTHLGIKHYLVRNYGEDKLHFFFLLRVLLAVWNNRGIRTLLLWWFTALLINRFLWLSINLGGSLPLDLELFTPPVFQEELFRDVLMGVFSAKVN